eukprot:scaffold33538_cov179-Skeletonema_dohrnii-CCMP3373.AAC.7
MEVMMQVNAMLARYNLMATVSLEALPSNAAYNHNGRCDKNTPYPIALEQVNTREMTRTKVPPEM